MLSRGSLPGSPNQVLINGNSRKRKGEEGRKQGQHYVSGNVVVYFRHIGNAHNKKRCLPVLNPLIFSYLIVLRSCEKNITVPSAKADIQSVLWTR